MNAPEIAPGAVVWASLDPVQGREQGGRRPVLVISSQGFLEAVTTLAVVLPITTVDRGWPNHVPVHGPAGLEGPSWVMTEQPRTLSRGRLRAVAGSVSPACLAEVRTWLSDLLDL